MNSKSDKDIDLVAWARRVNGRWIVHSGLNQSLSEYFDHLERADPERLIRSCRLAHRMVRSLEPGEDPKPWFYGGLFSLSTGAEARRFLAGHPFLASVVPCLQGGSEQSDGLKDAAKETRDKIHRLRATLETMAKSPAA
jgi:hypothetical protein